MTNVKDLSKKFTWVSYFNIFGADLLLFWAIVFLIALVIGAFNLNYPVFEFNSIWGAKGSLQLTLLLITISCMAVYLATKTNPWTYYIHITAYTAVLGVILFVVNDANQPIYRLSILLIPTIWVYRWFRISLQRQLRDS
ncbi:MAG: hypothetical protein NUV82_00210 [Candidatus Komeilibacteria bacterium]|nr:hypothetical protein [Candidatus Komeilibacteria bacterium]